MSKNANRGQSLLYRGGGRKYLNAQERHRFLAAAEFTEPETRLFCKLLGWSGARISEILALTPAAIDLDGGTASIDTLKRRRPMVRQVPLPSDLLQDLNQLFQLRLKQRDTTACAQRLWTWSRTTAWRRVKAVLKSAGIAGPCAMPKGLRHAFGVGAFQANVPAHLVQRWLGHASLRTTAIYCDVIGPEERAFASRMWPRELQKSLGMRLLPKLRSVYRASRLIIGIVSKRTLDR